MESGSGQDEEIDDEELARRLQAEEDMAAYNGLYGGAGMQAAGQPRGVRTRSQSQ